MKNKASVIVIGILLAVLAVIGIVIGSYWDKFKMFISGDILITQEEANKRAQEQYNLGYENGSKNIEILQVQINNQTATIEQNNIELKNLRSELSSSQEQGILDAQTIASLETRISNLEIENAQLKNLIKAYEDALPILVDDNQAIVKFIVGDELKQIKVVDKNTIITEPYEITFEEGNVSTFNGWKVNDELVDITNYVVTDHVTFVADITEKCEITYTVNGASHSSEIVVSGSIPNYPTITGYDNYFFKGWYNGETKIDTSTFVATENVTLNAVYVQNLTATFVANDIIYSTQLISVGEELTLPTDPTQIVNGRTSRFNGWKVNDEFVDLTTYVMSDDTTFVADFSEQIVITVHAYTKSNASDTTYREVTDNVKTITMYAGDVIVYPEIAAGTYRDSFFGYAYSATASGRNSYLGSVSYLLEGAVIIEDFTSSITNISQYEYINLGETPIFYSDCNIAVLFRSNP